MYLQSTFTYHLFRTVLGRLYDIISLSFYLFLDLLLQAASKKVITRVDWEKKLNDVNLRKDDMNKLVMNFLVTEGYVDVAEKFRLESGTVRILF